MFATYSHAPSGNTHARPITASKITTYIVRLLYVYARKDWEVELSRFLNVLTAARTHCEADFDVVVKNAVAAIASGWVIVRTLHDCIYSYCTQPTPGNSLQNVSTRITFCSFYRNFPVGRSHFLQQFVLLIVSSHTKC